MIGNLEVMAYNALVALELKLTKDGPKEQFLELMLMPKYLYSLTFSIAV